MFQERIWVSRTNYHIRRPIAYR